MQIFDHVWHGPGMVCHMMPIMSHELIDYEKNPWPKPHNGHYFS
jgi:hypothetical protein